MNLHFLKAQIAEIAPSTRPPLVLVINLDRSHDRWCSVSSALRGIGVDPVRIPAVDGRKLSDADLRAYANPDLFRLYHGRTIMPAEVGCYVSHVRAMEAFRGTHEQHCVILEDDAELGADFLATITALAESDMHGFDMVKLQGKRDGLSIPVKACGPVTLHTLLTRVTGSTAYMINRKAADTYLRKLLPMTVPYDHAFDRALALGLRIGAALPYPVDFNQSPSTIGYEGAKIGRLHGIKKLPSIAWRASTETQRVIGSVKTAVETTVKLRIGRRSC